jgi:2-polyprenyl-3-methyl-5-hydroxy-6-metoxy-1,4-benzoquinol methylase
MSTADLSRAEREKIAYDEQNVWEISNGWHRRFMHVFQSPNTMRHQRQFREWLLERAKGKRVLDVGCGRGDLSRELSEAGAAYVLGIDISENELGVAREHEIPGKLEFVLGSVEEPIEGKFDLICGASILHHLDYRPMLERMYRENLNPGGVIVFQEPLGGSMLIKLYKMIAKGAHTPDEQSFLKEDLRWFRRTFDKVTISPFNYFTFGAGVLSSKLFKRPDNFLLRLTDRLDLMVAKIAPGAAHRFRRCNIMIEK